MNYLLHHLAPFGLSLFIVIGLTPVWISICKKWNLFDEPDSRKHHRHLTPSMGGIAIFAGLFVSYLSFADVQEPDSLRYLIGACLILFFTGFFDDLMDVPAQNKLLLQIASALIVVAGGFRIESLNGFLGFEQIPVLLQWLLTVFLIVAFTNAYNFIDGIDGLAAMLGIVMLGAMGMRFVDAGRSDYAMLCFCACGALAGFLIFNVSPARLFMGDTGSLVIGFLTSVMAVKLSQTGAVYGQPVAPSAVLAIVFIPLLDISRVLVIRFLNGSSPFTPDRNHLHHNLLRFGFGHTSSALLIVLLALAVLIIQQQMAHLGTPVFLAGAVTVTLVLINARTLKVLVTVKESAKERFRQLSRRWMQKA